MTNDIYQCDRFFYTDFKSDFTTDQSFVAAHGDAPPLGFVICAVSIGITSQLYLGFLFPITVRTCESARS